MKKIKLTEITLKILWEDTGDTSDSPSNWNWDGFMQDNKQLGSMVPALLEIKEEIHPSEIDCS